MEETSTGSIKKMGSLEGITSLGPWGGPGGDPFSFIASQGIDEIVIYEGVNIKSITFGDANGQFSGIYGGKDNQDFGKKKTIYVNWPSEFLTSINGSYGDYKGILVITSLSFTTNRTTYGPFGTTSKSDISFSLSMEGGVIVGFHGRSGYYLDAFGIYVKPEDTVGSISLGPWGGPGGDPWSFIASRGINEIVIYQDMYIKSISFKDASGQQSETFGSKNGSGVKKTVNIDWPSEYLTSITGSYGIYYAGLLMITSLAFTTNRTTYGLFGTMFGTSFSIPVEGSVIVGFHGRAGDHLDAIGIYVKPL